VRFIVYSIVKKLKWNKRTSPYCSLIRIQNKYRSVFDELKLKNIGKFIRYFLYQISFGLEYINLPIDKGLNDSLTVNVLANFTINDVAAILRRAFKI